MEWIYENMIPIVWTYNIIVMAVMLPILIREVKLLAKKYGPKLNPFSGGKNGDQRETSLRDCQGN